MDGFNRVCQKGYEMTYPNLTEEQSKRVQEFSRAQVDAMCAYTEAERRLTELERENAKLREMVEDMLSCIEIRSAFNRPPTTKMYEEFAQQARELGIEADW